MLSLPRPAVDPRLLARAVAPGRVLGLGTAIYERALDTPERATSALRSGLREARALHSRERRFVADALHDLVRWGRLLDHAAGHEGPHALRRWLAWCVHLGAPAEVAAATWAATTPAQARFAALALPADRPDLAAGVAPDEVARLASALGDALPAFLAASNTRAPTDVRLAPGLRDRALATLHARGAAATPTPLAPHGLRLPPSVAPDLLDALPGPWELQDEASQLVATLVNPHPGARVLDAAAGAGGKTLALAALAPRARLVACDIRPAALDQLRRRAHAAGASVEVVRVADGDLPAGPFDRILVDAPCTGTGVWRRHPELRWRLPDLPTLTATQDRLLHLAAARLAPGGLLVYATCSILRDEDEDRAAALTAAHPELDPVDAWSPLPPDVAARVASGPFVRTFPHVHGTDGFFAAAWRRR